LKDLKKEEKIEDNMINIYCSSRYKISSKLIANYAQTVLDSYGVSKNIELNIAFVGVRKMKQVANEYKKENVALPVLSFAYPLSMQNADEQLLGEVVICYPQAILLAAERDKKVDTMLSILIEHAISNIMQK